MTPEEASVLEKARGLFDKDPAAAESLLTAFLRERRSAAVLFELGTFRAGAGDPARAAELFQAVV